MATPHVSFDPGLTQQYTGPIRRAVNRDGSFNVLRKGIGPFAGNLYLRMVTMSWPRFLSSVAVAYLIVNLCFAILYESAGPQALHASDRDLGLTNFERAFFFSVHTLTTVGYGALYPFGMTANILAAVEAAMGLMGFALATGLMYGRFSRPSARLVFSDTMVVAPFRDATSLQFRLANQRSNVMTELEANMMLMTVEKDAGGQLKRNFIELSLERRGIFFLALTWTVVHPIDEASPLWKKSAEDLERLQAEVLILVKGYDDSFSQVLHARYSYRWDEILWSARFVPAFEASPSGHVILHTGKISHTTPV